MPESVHAITASPASLTALLWRFDLLDRTIYPKRSICTQYQESDWGSAARAELAKIPSGRSTSIERMIMFS